MTDDPLSRDELFGDLLEDEVHRSPGGGERVGNASLRADDFSTSRQREEERLVDGAARLRIEEAALRAREKAAPPPRRRRWRGLSWILAAVLLSAAAAGGYGLWLRLQSSRAEEAVRAALAARKSASEARRMALSRGARAPAPLARAAAPAP